MSDEYVISIENEMYKAVTSLRRQERDSGLHEGQRAMCAVVLLRTYAGT